MNVWILYGKMLSCIKKTKNTAQRNEQFLNFSRIAKHLCAEILHTSYTPKRFSCFAVHDPKPREIFAPHFRDRVMHHFLIDAIEPLINPRFIDDSFANRRSKGTHQAIKRLRHFLHKNNTVYYLQIDIYNFFPSIDKKILYEILQSTLHKIALSQKEKELYSFLAKQIIFHNPTKPSPIFSGNKKLLALIPFHKSLFNNPVEKGLPIGSLSSQFFANLYLNELDQFCKHILKIKYYIRYVDDIIIVADNPTTLNNYKASIQQFLKEQLHLSLHPKKTILQHTAKGINFLGYIIRKDYILVRRRTIRSFKKRLYFFNHLIDTDNYPLCNAPHTLSLYKKCTKEIWQLPITPQLSILVQMLATINSYYGIFCFADSFRLRKDLYENHFGELKNFFEPTDKTYRVMKIKKGAYLYRTQRT